MFRFLMIALTVLLSWHSALAQNDTFRAAMSADLKILDPQADTANITRIYANAVFDTLFGEDAQGHIQPQMVGAWQETPDHLTWSFTLRDGLAFHDGTPVTAADCVASLRRWAPRDALGRLLAGRTERFEVVDARTFRIVLKQPYPLMLETLGKPRNPAAVILPERLASIAVGQPMVEPIGSGPFIFKRDELVPGAKAVFVRNPAYVPRSEPASFLAGGKVPRLARIEWLVMPDGTTAVNTLIKGEIDFVENVSFDSAPLLRRAAGVTLSWPRTAAARRFGVLRPNSGTGVFADDAIRRVLWQVIDSEAIPAAMGVPEDLYVHGCRTIFGCDGPYQIDAGLAALPAVDPKAAREALKRTSYAGQKVVILQAQDLAESSIGSEVVAAALREAGFVVEIQAMDWGTLLARRAKKDGWDLFAITAGTWDMGMPLTNFYIAGTCTNFPGNHCDPRIKASLERFMDVSTDAQRLAIAAEIQIAAFESTPFVLTGQYSQYRAVRQSVRNMDHEAIFPLFWGVEKQ